MKNERLFFFLLKSLSGLGSAIIIIVLLALMPFFISTGCFGNQDDENLNSQLTYDPAGSGIVADGTGTLGGFVVSDTLNKFSNVSHSLASVSKVKITLVQTGIFTYTDASGYYEFSKLKPGLYTVCAVRNDVDGSRYINYVPAEAKAGQKTLASKTIILKKASGVKGKIKTSDAMPADGFEISVENNQIIVESSSNGYFELLGAAAGQDIYIQVSKAGYEKRRLGPFELLEGDSYFIGEDIIMNPTSSFSSSVSGVLSDSSTGLPLSNALLNVYRADAPSAIYKSVRCGLDGKYALLLESSRSYTLEFSRENYYNYMTELAATAGSSLINASLTRSVAALSNYEIAGRVVDGVTKLPLKGATVYTTPFTSIAAADSSGKYSLSLCEGNYVIHAVLSEYDSAETSIKIGRASSSSISDLELFKNESSKLYRLYGTVVNSNNAAMTNLKVSVDKFKLYTYTNQSGGYSLYLPSGTHEVGFTNNIDIIRKFETVINGAEYKFDINIGN